jgi:hypothetical protein
MLEVMRTVRTIGIAAVSGLTHARRFGKTESAECPKEHTATDIARLGTDIVRKG